MASFAVTLRWRTPCVALLCAGTSALIGHKICRYLTLFFKLDKALVLFLRLKLRVSLRLVFLAWQGELTLFAVEAPSSR